MDTTRILAFRHPSQLAMLMDSLVDAAVRLPETAARVNDRSSLPAALQRIVIRAAKSRMEWRAWLQGAGIILITAEHITPPTTHPKSPTLRLSICGASGAIKDRSDWVYLPNGTWQRLRKLS